MRYFSIFLCLLLAGCSAPVKDDSLRHLEGLWEIEQVEMADGSQKDYKISEIVDKFNLDKKKGTRTKVRVNFGGDYPAAAQPDSVFITRLEDKVFIEHKAQHIRWREEVVELDSLHLVLRNPQGIEYRYKRHVPMNLKP